VRIPSTTDPDDTAPTATRARTIAGVAAPRPLMAAIDAAARRLGLLPAPDHAAPVDAEDAEDADDADDRIRSWRDPHGGVAHVAIDLGPVAPRSLLPADPVSRAFHATVVADDPEVADQLRDAIGRHDRCLSEEEQALVTAAMPILGWAARTHPIPAGRWRIVFRDHLVENALGFVRALLAAGVPPEDVMVLDKGDRTLNRVRIAGTLRAHGVDVRRLDNAAVDRTASPAEAERAVESARAVDRFVAGAHASGQRVVMVDDGGLLGLADADGRPVLRERPDAAVELTVSGLKRLSRSPLARDLPVADMARSAVKQRIAYAEIADSCIRRLREALRGEKLIGTRVVSVGFGSLGARIAAGLRALGCRVVVVDTDHLQLIQAAEDGFETTPSIREAIALGPTLLVSSTGEPIADAATLRSLPSTSYVTAFATADLSALGDRSEGPPVVLGDGRSFNLHRFEGIPNGGYDVYRAATWIVIGRLAERVEDDPRAAVSLADVDGWVRASGIYERYYEHHFRRGA
jgi:adenosylhomocysteinase